MPHQMDLKVKGMCNFLKCQKSQCQIYKFMQMTSVPLKCLRNHASAQV